MVLILSPVNLRDEKCVLGLVIARIERSLLLERPIIIVRDTLEKIERSTGYAANRPVEAIGDTLIDVASVEALITLIERNKTLKK